MIEDNPRRGAPNTIAELVSGQFQERVAVIWSGARIADYLLASDARRHLWHAWLTVRLPTTIESNAMSSDIVYKMLSGARGKDLAVQAFGDCPPGFLKALGRLGPSARAPDVYRALATILAHGGPAAKHVLHAKILPDDVLLGLAGLPRDPKLAQVMIGLFLKHAFSPRKMGEFAWALSRLGALYGRETVEQIIAAANPWDALWDALFDHDFPPPPFPRTARMAAVASASDLREVAARFTNCLTRPEAARSALRQVANGAAYFYEWRGEEPALLEFIRIGALGWRLRQARGIRNADLSETTKFELTQSLVGLGPVCPLVDEGAMGFVIDGEDHFFRNLE